MGHLGRGSRDHPLFTQFVVNKCSIVARRVFF